MSTLLEKPSSPAAVPPVHPPLVLHTRHQWLRWRGTLIVGIAGLAATLLALWLGPRHGPGAPHGLALELWAGGVLLTALGCAIAHRLAPVSLLATAQKLDHRFAAKNRLEAVVGLKDSTSPLAEAHRRETALHLGRTPEARPVRILPWLAAGLIALILTHFLLLVAWFGPSLFHPSKSPAPKPPPAAKDVPQAAIAWSSPGAETKANPVEEVPTVASARSSSGLQNMTLEVSVNGTPKKSVPLPADPYDKPGTHEIKTSLYLDELDVQPYDVVSYYLRGQRISSGKLPDVTSSIQFVQVRPFREDVGQGAGRSSKGYDLLIRLKLAQLRSVKENFVLAHTDLPVTNPVRMSENERVGKNQAALSGKAEEIVQLFITDGMPAEMIDLLRQAEPPMDDGAKKILATQNAAALLPQQKALNLIVEVEKFFHKFIGPVTGPSSYNPDDPFKDKQKHQMTERPKMPSGQLETLVKNQTHLSHDLSQNPNDTTPAPVPAASSPPSSATPTPPGPNSPGAPADSTQTGSPATPAPQAVDPFGPDAEQGTFAERQTRVLQGIEVLQNGNKVFPDAVNDALALAQKDATTSLQRLHAQDGPAAREPAAAAARDLQLALKTMNDAGDQETKEAMEDAQQKLNDLAGQLRHLAQAKPADAGPQLMKLAQQVHDVRQNLEDAADHQQQAGSALGAAELNRLAQALQEGQYASELAAMSKAGLDPGKAAVLADSLEDLAGKAAHNLTPVQPVAQDYVAMVNALERTRANLAYLAAKAGLPAPGTLPPTPGTTPGIQPGGTAQHGTAGPGQQNAPAGQQTGTSISGQAGRSPSAGQGQGQGQGNGQTPGSGTPSPGNGSSGSSASNASPPSPSGSSQGSGRSGESSSDSGSGSGSNPAAGSGSGTGDSASGTAATDAPHSPTEATPSAAGTPSTPADANLEAYREALANLKNQTQQTEPMVPRESIDELEKTIIRYDKDTSYRPVSPVDIVRFYTDVQKPLEKLILDLQTLQQHAQRTEVVKMPDLDETPPAYRPAVSDYFESVSRDYRPAPPADNPKP